MTTFRHSSSRSIWIGMSCVAIGAVVAGGVRPAFAGDDHGDAPMNATLLPLGATLAGIVGTSTDQDWFVVQPTPPTPFVVWAGAGDRSIPRVQVYDGDLRLIASGPALGSVNFGAPFALPLPFGLRPPVRVRVTSYIGTGAYTLSAVAGGPVMPPSLPPPLPPPLPAPPAPLPVPADDVGEGSAIDLSLVPLFDGRLGIPGDVDPFRFAAPMDGDYTFALTSPDGSLTDAVADATPGRPVFLATWIPQPGVLTLIAGQAIVLTVHSLGENVGAYRLTITPPTGAPVAPPPPPPPPAPVFGGLVVDPSMDMLARPARDYVSYVYGKFRIRDTLSANSELSAALAIRARWIARDRGQHLGVARADSAGALDAALVRFGNLAVAGGNFSFFSTRLRSLAVPGGGPDAASIVATVQAAISARRPLLLMGVRGDQLMEAWIVYGLETSPGGSVSLRALDPSSPGGSVLLPVAPHGLAPVGSGAGLVLRFAFAGGDRDLLP